MRIAILDPSMEDMLDALGFKDHIVGRDLMNLGNPHIVFTSAKHDISIRKELEKKYKVVHIAPKTMIQVFQDINHIGRVLEREDKANALVEKLKSQMLVTYGQVRDTEKKKVVVKYKNIALGKWVPKMIMLAGGISLLKEGAPNRPIKDKELMDYEVIDAPLALFTFGPRLAEGVAFTARTLHPDRLEE